ncbi:MAG: ATP-dependent RNA helicase [Candidatus Ozemobacter sibiricus]|uniref:RNA helicase n=1 Tax=Candidatus Ozemobacter sibiricus TaxID=2268124 RepID=A0A367ZNY7_9BACT|nr:MAG: ATP-dependent RNA helicase [Candidatus Ozemobacter sibiricus]
MAGSSPSAAVTAPDAPAAAPDTPPAPAYPPFTFDDLPEPLRRAVAAAGWHAPMPVQAQVIPWLLDGRDIIVQSQTGSGKTGAFLLPLLCRIDPAKPVTQALILAPTRELALQVKAECDRLAGTLGVRSVAVYGGVGYGAQLQAFREGAHLVVGTPGRLLDHLGRKSLSLQHLRYLVIDEADELLSMGFWPDMRRIRAYLPRQRVSAMFSATMPGGVRLMAEEFLRQPEFIGLSADHVHVTEMDHVYYVVDPMQKDRVLMRILELENPASAIIFCNTKSEVEYLAAFLRRFGYDVDQISGDVSQKERENVMARLKKHTLRLMVATDVAARGIDVSHLEYVFIYDFPPDFEQYIHRAGRTARAGNRGVAVSLVSMVQEMDLKRAGKRYGVPFIKKNTPTEEEVQARLAERLLARLEARLRDLDSATRERMRGFSRLLQDLRDHEQGHEMLLMLLDETATRLRLEGRPEPLPSPEPRGATAAGDEMPMPAGGQGRRGHGRSRHRGRRRS